MDIRNKVALITGSSRGVGRSVAQQLAARGCRVVINHRDSEDQAQETLGWIESHGGKAIILRADVSEESACRSLVNQTIAHWGQLDILINNAATTNFLRFDDLDALTEDHWDRVLPGKILRVNNEDVIEDLEGQVKRMLDYLELPFEEECISFYETGNYQGETDLCGLSFNSGIRGDGL